MKSKKKLAIIQTHPTQFDAGLFQFLSKENLLFDLTVIFTKFNSLSAPHDPEINITPNWGMNTTIGYKYISLPAEFIPKFLFLRKIFKYKKYDHVILSGYSSLTLIMGMLLGAIYGVSIGLRADSVNSTNRGIIKRLIRKIFLPILFRTYKFGHPVGGLTRDLMIDNGFNPKSLYIFPYAIDHGYLSRYKSNCVSYRQSIRKQLNIDKGDIVFIGVLKFVHREDPLTLIYAFNQIAEKFNNTQLILVGDGPLDRSVKEAVNKRYFNKVHFIGYIPYADLPKYYAASNIFVHPALDEPWGVSVNEAMFFNLTVLISDRVGAGFDLVFESINGYIFKNKNCEDLTNKMMTLCNITDLEREKMGNESFKIISKWDYSLTKKNLNDCLASL
jgi:glycosyltransferase involved in cell wall biosynthesis